MVYGYDSIKPYIGDVGDYNEDGDWVVGDGEWGDPIPCDVEQPTSSGSPATAEYEGGKSTEYSYVVWLDPSERKFTTGDRVLLQKGNEPEVECSVKGFRRYRTYSKIWL